MILAIPTRDGMVDSHFGHCAYYTVIETNEEKEIVLSAIVTNRWQNPRKDYAA